MLDRILMLNKPKGYEVTRPNTLESEAYPGQKTVYSLIPSRFHNDRWMPVGRLDKDSRGLLLFVRDGFLVAPIQKPHNIHKIYEVLVWGQLQPVHVEIMLRGVETPIGVLKAKSLEILSNCSSQTIIKVILDEGKNRQIRRMFAGLRDLKTNRPIKVLELKRTHMGPIKMDVEEGNWRFLSDLETDDLLNSLPKIKKIES